MKKHISELWQTSAFLSDNLISNYITDLWLELCEADLHNSLMTENIQVFNHSVPTWSVIKLKLGVIFKWHIFI